MKLLPIENYLASLILLFVLKKLKNVYIIYKKSEDISFTLGYRGYRMMCFISYLFTLCCLLFLNIFFCCFFCNVSKLRKKLPNSSRPLTILSALTMKF